MSQTTETSASKIREFFSFKRIAIPVLLSMALVAYLMYSRFDEIILGYNQYEFSRYTFIWLAVAVLLIVLRHLFYMLRLRILSEKSISWTSTFDIITVWEFASTITPSSTGGTLIAPLILYKEGINAGKSTALIISTLFLDNVMFLFTLITFYLIYGNAFLPENPLENGRMAGFVGKYLFWIASGTLLTLGSLLFYGLFINKNMFSLIIDKVSLLPLIRRRKDNIQAFGKDVAITAEELGKKSKTFWFKAFSATWLAWSSRFLLGAVLVQAFSNVLDIDYLLTYARQAAIWTVAGAIPTPGATGIMTVFTDFFREFTGDGLAELVAFIWRFLTYFIYIFIGLVILPKWIRKVYA